jgi:hypothetical protein
MSKQVATPAQALIAQALAAVYGAPKASRAKAAKRVATPVVTAYVPGPTVYPKDKKTWTGYMIQVTLKASSPADAVKLHKAKAARAGYPASKPLDFKWMLAKGYIAAK